MKLTAPKTTYELLKWISVTSYIILIIVPITQLLYFSYFGIDIFRLLVSILLLGLALFLIKIDINNIKHKRMQIKLTVFIGLICILFLRSYGSLQNYILSDMLITIVSIFLLFIIFNYLSSIIDGAIKR